MNCQIKIFNGQFQLHNPTWNLSRARANRTQQRVQEIHRKVAQTTPIKGARFHATDLECSRDFHEGRSCRQQGDVTVARR